MARKSKQASSSPQGGMFDGTGTGDDLLHINSAAPAQLLHESRSRRRRALVWTFIIVGFLTMAMSINTMVTAATTKVKPNITTSTQVNFSAGKSAAQTKVASWLAQTPSPLPGGYVVSWDGFDTIAGGTAKNNSDNPANAAELHHFTLATRTGESTLFYDADVLVSVSKALGASAATDPSLLPRVPSTTQGWSPQLWPGYENAQVPDAATQTVDAWAAAFTGTADTLRLYVGDEDGTRSYMPLQGARVLSATVPSAGYVKVEGEDKPKVIIARVELVLAWSSAADAKGAKVTYDVRIEQAQTASPKVVAWGPAGTGPRLEKYGNAVTGTTITGGSSNDHIPTAAPTPTATSGGTN